MGMIVSIWGVVMMCMGFVQNFAGLCVTRVLLGLFEQVLASVLRPLFVG